jgi:hypothetical protein
MRYLILTYVTRPDRKIDEVMTVTRNLKARDLSTANVILDFKKMDVVKCSMGGVNVPRDFNRIVEYYMQHYESTITRLFKENGYQVEYIKKDAEVQPSNSDPS